MSQIFVGYRLVSETADITVWNDNGQVLIEQDEVCLVIDVVDASELADLIKKAASNS